MAHRSGVMKDDLFFHHFKSVKQKESDFFSLWSINLIHRVTWKEKKVVSFWLDVFRFKQLLCFYLNPKVPKSLDVLGKQRKVVHQPSVATGSLDIITWFLELICDLHMKFTYKVGLKESLSPHLHWHIPATVINEYLSASVFSGFHPNVLWMNAAPAAGEQLC